MNAHVAILTPAYNAGRFLRAAIGSVLLQTHDNWTLIIVNDGSQDNTEEIARAFAAQDRRIQVYTQSNQGISATRNAALKSVPTDCDYIMNLDADDVLEPTALSVLTQYLEEHATAGAVFCGASIIDGEGLVQGQRKTHRFTLLANCPVPVGNPGIIPFFNFYCGYGVGPFALLRHSSTQQAGKYNTDLYSCEDVDMFARIALISEVHQIGAPLYRYRWHTTNTSSYNNKNQLAMEQFHTIWRNKSLTDPAQVGAYQKALWFHEKWHPLILHGKFAIAALRDAIKDKSVIRFLQESARLGTLLCRILLRALCSIATFLGKSPKSHLYTGAV